MPQPEAAPTGTLVAETPPPLDLSVDRSGQEEHDARRSYSYFGPGRLLTLGVAALSLLTFKGVASPAPVQAAVSPAAEGAPRAKPHCVDSDIAVCYWKVVKTRHVDGTHRHPWIDCVRFGRSRYVQHVTCSIAKSKSDTVSAQVTGGVEVGFGKLSAAVGYNVTKTTTVTASETIDVPKKTPPGVIQWAGFFGDRREVKQEYQPCYQNAPGRFGRCEPQPHPSNDNLAHAFTERYLSPVFRARRHRQH
jgi:hypothetical protein